MFHHDYLYLDILLEFRLFVSHLVGLKADVTILTLFAVEYASLVFKYRQVMLGFLQLFMYL